MRLGLYSPPRLASSFVPSIPLTVDALVLEPSLLAFHCYIKYWLRTEHSTVLHQPIALIRSASCLSYFLVVNIKWSSFEIASISCTSTSGSRAKTICLSLSRYTDALEGMWMENILHKDVTSAGTDGVYIRSIMTMYLLFSSWGIRMLIRNLVSGKSWKLSQADYFE